MEWLKRQSSNTSSEHFNFRWHFWLQFATDSNNLIRRRRRRMRKRYSIRLTRSSSSLSLSHCIKQEHTEKQIGHAQWQKLLNYSSTPSWIMHQGWYGCVALHDGYSALVMAIFTLFSSVTVWSEMWMARESPTIFPKILTNTSLFSWTTWWSTFTVTHSLTLLFHQWEDSSSATVASINSIKMLVYTLKM